MQAAKEAPDKVSLYLNYKTPWALAFSTLRSGERRGGVMYLKTAEDVHKHIAVLKGLYRPSDEFQYEVFK